jgi:hypothetical protein
VSSFSQYAQPYNDFGIVHIPGVLDERAMRNVDAAFAQVVDNPSPGAFERPATGPFVYSDNGNTSNWKTPAFQALLFDSSLGDVCQALFEAPDVWFIHDQVFWKQGGGNNRTPWHQDATHWNFDGPDYVSFWIALSSLPRQNALEFVRRTHRGPIYSQKPGKSRSYRTHVTVPGRPILPDIDESLEDYDIVGWPVERGDVLAFHGRTIHGGAPGGPDISRKSLTLRFCGRKTVRTPSVPGQMAAALGDHGLIGAVEKLQLGEPIFQVEDAIQVRPHS